MSLARPLLLAAALGALLLGAAQWWPRTVDDAFITFRYADNVVAGHGPVFNPGERVEGYSSPAWLLLAVAAIAAGGDPVVVVKWAGLACSLALVLLVHAGARRAGTVGWGAALAALVVGSSVVLRIWSVSGLETPAFALLFFAGILLVARGQRSARAALAASAVLAAAALTRPEGAGLWLLGGLACAGVGAAGGRARRLAAYAAPGLALAAHLAWRLGYYGHPWPNTYYAKTGGGLRMWLQGLHGLGLFLAEPEHALLVAAAVAGLVSALRRPATRRTAAVAGLAVALHVAYVVSVGDDGLYVYRFHLAILAPLALLAAQLLPRADAAAEPEAPLRSGLAVGALVAATGISLWSFQREMLPALHSVAADYLEGNVKLGRYLATTFAEDTWIAVPSAGAVPYYSRLPAIDMYGLNDEHIARGPFPEGAPGRMMKWDIPYVLSRHPRLIVINRGYFAASDPRGETVLRDPAPLLAAPMDRDLYEHLRRDGGYAPRVIVFPDGSRFYLYERIDAR